MTLVQEDQEGAAKSLLVEVLAFPQSVNLEVARSNGEPANVTQLMTDVSDHMTSAMWTFYGTGNFIVHAENEIGSTSQTFFVPEPQPNDGKDSMNSMHSYKNDVHKYLISFFSS